MKLVAQEWKRFRLAFSFLTTIPFPHVKNADNKDFAKSLVYAPIVGLFIGVCLFLTWSIACMFISSQIAAFFVIIIYVFLTGGLHLDGLADTCDGIFSNRPKDRVLEIMRDSRVGTNGVLALIFILLAYWIIISSLPPVRLDQWKLIGFGMGQSLNSIVVLLLMPVAGRIGSIVGAGLSVYARKEEGLGKSFLEILGYKEALVGGLLAFVLFVLIAGWRGIILYTVVILFTLLGIHYFKRKLGGSTGDTLGALCELNQAIFLISIVILGGL